MSHDLLASAASASRSSLSGHDCSTIPLQSTVIAGGHNLRFSIPQQPSIMSCFGGRRRPADVTPKDYSLTFIRPGYLQVRSSQGYLYYLPAPSLAPTPPPTSPRFFRNRVSRPTSLCIAAVRADHHRALLPRCTDRTAHFPLRALARSRENTKRFLRLSLSQNTQPVIVPSADQPQSEVASRAGVVEDMVSGDGGRQSPIRRDRTGSGVGGPVSGMVRRPQLAEELRTLSTQTSGSESGPQISALCDEKPIATGNGISISISLAEPVLYLQGFDQNDSTSGTTTMLRGSLHLHVTKQAKLKSISLNFRGRSETEWPEGIPPRRTEFQDAETIMSHTWPFFNAQFPQAEHSYCADLVHLAKGPTVSTKEVGVTASSFDLFQRTATPRPNVTSREAKRLSLQLSQSKSFGRGDNIHGGPTTAQRGFKVFHPGDYVYNFELPVDSRLPESISVELGNVRYELEALVERSGAFRANLVGVKELTMIRAPAEGSLEQIEPIAISRNWEDQLHYDIVISGKSFPLGASVPIAFKLTPLAKVQCHRIKVFVTENIQYFTANKRVHRLEPTRKLQLFEKRADGPSISAFPGSSVRVTAGGGIAWDHREAAARGEEDIPRDPVNLLGNLDHDNASIGPTEMEFTVKLPSCYEMNDRTRSERIHFDTTYQNIQVNHWIKIVMRLSRPDENDPTKRRHFEISIDSPFHILSCRATAANTYLPAYTSGRVPATPADEFDCGCPGAAVRKRNTPTTTTTLPATNASTTTIESAQAGATRSWTNNTGGLTAPRPAHVHDPSSGVQDPNSGAPRPIHLLRNPSFNPPPFSEEEPPPPVMTPPPNYDNVVSGDSRSALADYFARLADEIGDEDEQGNRGRVDIPLTPGARVNRSMDASRTWLPLGAHAAT